MFQVEVVEGVATRHNQEGSEYFDTLQDGVNVEFCLWLEAGVKGNLPGYKT